jgi:hypothetical protein
MPAGPGAHKRLQQSPQPVQSTPSTLVQYEGPFGGSAQVPTVFPVAIVQSAAQQSLSCAQLSPGWVQKEAVSAQCLVPSHNPEQQSPLAAHVLPAVEQLVLSGVHVLPVPQVPLQHSSLLVQALVSETHWADEHFPPTQLKEQQSVPAVQSPAAAAHVVSGATQPLVGSQIPEQQSVPVAQVKVTALQLPFDDPADAPEPPTPWSPPPPSGPLAAVPALPALAPPSLELLPHPVHAAAAMMNVATTVRAIRMLSLQ